MKRSQSPTQWPECPKCRRRLNSKGLVERQINSLIGVIHWKHRVGRCPHGCKIGQIAPLDNSLGLEPHQLTSIELQRLGCLLAVFVPFETLSILLNSLTTVQVSCVTLVKGMNMTLFKVSEEGGGDYLNVRFDAENLEFEADIPNAFPQLSVSPEGNLTKTWGAIKDPR